MILSVDEGNGTKTSYRVTQVIDSTTLEITDLLELKMLRPVKQANPIRRENAPYKDIE